MFEIAISRFMLALPLALLPGLAHADFIAPVDHELTRNECSACHMAYPSGLLPAASWGAIMDGLDDHFGEDASLPAEATAEIRTYLETNAGREPRGFDPANPTLRITELRWFLHEHSSRLRKLVTTNPGIGAMSNCAACHRGAEQGYFDD